MASKILYAGKVEFPLMKIQTDDIIDKIMRGYIRFNSLKFYRELYNKYGDKTIGDPNEGKFFIHDGIFKNLETGEIEYIKDCYFPTANENDFVFCLFGINPQKYTSFIFSEEQKQKLLNFHDKTLLITDVKEFMKRMYNAANKQGLKLTNGFVNYYDTTIDDVNYLLNLVTIGTESIVYYKTNDYAYQQEFRFAIPNTTGTAFIDLQIGDISDITQKFTTEQVLCKSQIKIDNTPENTK